MYANGDIDKKTYHALMRTAARQLGTKQKKTKTGTSGLRKRRKTDIPKEIHVDTSEDSQPDTEHASDSDEGENSYAPPESR